MSNNSMLGYRGTVRIDIYRGDRLCKTLTQHNEGTPELFRYIANALAGNTNSALMPRYIHTFYCTKFDPTTYVWDVDAVGNELYGSSKSTCSYNTPFSSVEVRYDKTLNNNEGGYNTLYTFLLPYNQIAGTTNVVCLYNSTGFGDNIIPLAYIKLDHDDWLALSDNNDANIVITWIMTVSNVKELGD